MLNAPLPMKHGTDPRQKVGVAEAKALSISRMRQKITYIRQSRGEFFELILGRLRGKPFFRHTAVNSADLNFGLTLVLPGIEAAGPFANAMVKGLSGVIPGAVQMFYWGIPFPEGYLPNLMWLRRNRSKAAELTRIIMRYQDEYPGRPIHIIANSGGAGPALFAVESLPEDRSIDGLVLLSGAISNTYNLSTALRRLRKGLFNFYSHRDWLVLGLGTTLFGTCDRKPRMSCGFVGFKQPTGLADAAPYTKLHQVPWNPSLIDDCGHWGTHSFSSSEQYIRRHVAPWIAGEEQNH